MSNSLFEKKILLLAVEKLLRLREIAEWQKELLPLAPPVLWFGDTTSDSPKVLTLGANPSRKEFLYDHKTKAIEKLQTQNLFSYLKGRDKRFFHFEKESDLVGVQSDLALQKKIIDSYNSYFRTTPYNWFGKKDINGNGSYNVEGFLNGLDASYYGHRKFQAIHIDLLPYPTLSDFNDISGLCEKDIFTDNWGENVLYELIDMLKPKYLIIFGRNNLNYFRSLFTLDIGQLGTFESQTGNNNMSKCSYWSFDFNCIPTIGLSVNLGNPKGFDKKTLNLLGKKIKNEMDKTL